MMKVLIISLDKKESAQLEANINRLAKKPESVDLVYSLDEAGKYLDKEDSPDLIFNLCKDQILDFLKFFQKNQIQSALVFIADNDKHINSTFLFNTLNFISGKASIEDVKFCFDKHATYFKEMSDLSYKNDIRELMKFMSNREKEFKKRFMVKIGNVIRSVNVEDIAYFFSQERINYLVKYNGKKFPIDNTLDEVEEMVDPDKFFRANRQFIINIDAIAEIHPYFKGRVKLNLNPQQEGDLIISAEKSRSFKDWLDE
ncbi:MAG: LytTR family transcriptional regulator [Chitinophagales bacterium]|nr:LytTR family transcriptional regulator [Chitinophagales bacterium]